MPDVPYPITAENSEDLKRQVWQLIREIFEERIGGLNMGDVFEDSGGVLSLRLGATNPCLQKVANALQLEIKSASGLQATSTGLATKLKSAGGLDVDSSGLYIDGSAYGYGTIDCPSGTDPIASQTNDTLVLAEGTGISITGDVTTDTVTIGIGSVPHMMQSDNTNQSIANVSNAQVITFDTDNHHMGITRTSSSRFTILKAGSYLITFSGMCQSAVAGKRIEVWLKKNTAYVDYSNTIYMFKATNATAVVAVSFIEHFAVNDYFEFWTWGDDTGVKWNATAAGSTPTRPACPSIIMTCNYVGTD